MANMSAMMKECTKPHPLMHSLAGIGLGILLVGLVPALSGNGVVLGLILVVAGIVGDMMVNKG